MLPSECDAVGRCLNCAANSQCQGSFAPFCDLDLESWYYGSCVWCESDADCAEGVCEPYTRGGEEPGTRDFRDCRLAGGTVCGSDAGFYVNLPLCDPASGECVWCESDSDCPQPGYELCDTQSKICVACASTADCDASEPGCYLGQCGWCGADADCPAGMQCSILTSRTFFPVPVGSCTQGS